MNDTAASSPASSATDSTDDQADQSGSASDDPPQRWRGPAIQVTIDDQPAPLDGEARAWLASRLRDAAGEALKGSASVGEASSAHEIRVRVVGGSEMAGLHERHSGERTTTDVLTFDLREDPSGALDVDIVVCRDVAAARAGSAALIGRELLLYALHGLLHCLGHDDHDDAGYARMHAREDTILEAVGVGAVFGADGGGS